MLLFLIVFIPFHDTMYQSLERTRIKYIHKSLSHMFFLGFVLLQIIETISPSMSISSFKSPNAIHTLMAPG